MSYFKLRCAAALVVVFGAGQVHAAVDAGASCFIAPAKASPEQLDSFSSQPADLTTKYPTGGAAMSLEVRTLAGSRFDNVDRLVQLAAGASPGQKSAIGAGLAWTARACAASQPEYALQIQEKIAASGLDEVITAFLGAANDTATAALGNGAAAAAAGDIGNTGAIGNSGNVGGDVATATAAPARLAARGAGRSTTIVTNVISPN
ncbi:hypothetical protein RLEG12_08405 (plasmid) [Rhizobium leguminosarum bv. trifolii CB782]|uniref:hypothetical protein n=1 Tax=Rhizobium hidalgonense TaxID=1538159 RepID=UPI0003E2D8C8|nr:hypothetical protein [Rhizobium hidalgonense]AHG48950.1 hypothetical protein RLEG12_08405 [Rhizobium leguminosarum bv. trifolii CB782]MDR9805500.1 hypothetical protein [Rhizobium hidalgonense]